MFNLNIKHVAWANCRFVVISQHCLLISRLSVCLSFSQSVSPVSQSVSQSVCSVSASQSQSVSRVSPEKRATWQNRTDRQTDGRMVVWYVWYGMV